MRQIRIKLTEEEEKKVAYKMATYKFNGSISKFAKKLLIQGSSYTESVKYLQQVYNYDFLLNKLEEIVESEPMLLRSKLLDFKQELVERMNDDIRI